MKALYHYTSEAQIARIGEGFLDLSLPKPEWTHGAHWAATFWILDRHPEINPEHEMPGLIRRYNEAKGGINSDTEGYHETITQGSLIVARGFLEKQTDAPALDVLCNRLFATRFGRSDWLFEHWTKDLLFSVTARREWVPPDIKPLSV
ncbi:MAG: hypothetical protein AAFW68_04100 [Pseudomonadota bacterium]